jgi:hypothetical protein
MDNNNSGSGVLMLIGLVMTVVATAKAHRHLRTLGTILGWTLLVCTVVCLAVYFLVRPLLPGANAGALAGDLGGFSIPIALIWNSLKQMRADKRISQPRLQAPEEILRRK